MRLVIRDKTIELSKVSAFVALMIAMLVSARDIAGLGLNSWIITAIVFCAYLVLDYENIVFLTMFIIPFLSGISAGRVMMLAFIFLLIKSKKIQVKLILMCCFIVAMELFASRWYPSSDHSQMMPYFTCSFVLFVMIFSDFRIDYKKTIQFYLFGIACAIAISLLGSISSGGLNAATLLSSRGHIGTAMESVDGAKLAFNANTYAYYCISGVCCGFVLLKNSFERREKRINAIVTGFLMFAGVFSISRTLLIVLGLCIFLYVCAGTNNISRLMKIGLLILWGVAFGVYVLNSNSAIVGAWISRFTGEDIQTGGQRVTLFQDYMNVFLDNDRFMWFGTGVTQYREVTHVYNSMHNSLQQILVCLGIPGAVIYLGTLISPVYKLRHFKITLLYWIPLIGSTIFLQSIQFLFPSFFIPTYVAAIYALRMGKDIE